jgi:hypothetical protein
MSFNDKTDIEAVLQVPPANSPSPPLPTLPPTLTTGLTKGAAGSLATDGLVNQALVMPPTPIGVPVAPAASPSGNPVPAPTSPPKFIQTQPSARPASVQLVPVPPTSPPAISALTQTLVVNGVNQVPQTPLTTTPGTLVQS